jgi:hypothetical protein
MHNPDALFPPLDPDIRIPPMLNAAWLLSALVSLVSGEIVDLFSDDLISLEYDFIIVGGSSSLLLLIASC